MVACLPQPPQSLNFRQGASHIGLARVSANGRPAARGGDTRDKRLSPSTSLGWSRTGPAFRPIQNAELQVVTRGGVAEHGPARRHAVRQESEGLLGPDVAPLH